VTNGTGSFASLNLLGGHSRKFHGLLIKSVIPPMDRLLTWHGCDERVNGVSLAADKFENTTGPEQFDGIKYLLDFNAKPIPTWRYNINGSIIKKELFMVRGQNTTIIRYSLLASPKPSVELRLANFVHFRKAEDHCPEFTNDSLMQWQVDAQNQQVSYKTETLKLACQLDGAQSQWTKQWLTIDPTHQRSKLIYDIEFEDQGFEHYDASLNVQNSTIVLFKGESCYMIGTTEQQWPSAKSEYQQALANSQKRFFANDFANDLAHSGQSFIADRQSVHGKTILAGFPWFGDWGRDTMIALPGITLATKQFPIARSILTTFAQYINGGMLPNKFPDRYSEPLKYNTIDATLWFFWSIQQYAHYSEDWSFIQAELYDDLKNIIENYKRGTRFGIGMDSDGLIQGGDEDTQLTWMDVKFDNFAVTPRYGKAVEINALWFNALNFMQQCAVRFQDKSVNLKDLINTVETNFNNVFWNDDSLCCFDYVTPEQNIGDIRCNQLFAVSLPFSPLSAERQASVFQSVYSELYTPVGIRSLSTKHVDYKGRYYGPLATRDVAYHQGTVWAWPMGAFIDAFMKVDGNKKT
jgi:predicted glycogen debranching enzyme